MTQDELPFATTQNEEILRYLRRPGASLTTAEAFSKLKTTKLGTRLSECRRLGWNIVSEWERGADNKKWLRYRMGSPERLQFSPLNPTQPLKLDENYE